MDGLVIPFFFFTFAGKYLINNEQLTINMQSGGES